MQLLICRDLRPFEKQNDNGIFEEAQH